METGSIVGHTDQDKLDPDFADFPKPGSVKDKIEIFTDSPHAVVSRVSPGVGAKGRELRSQRPLIPRKPTLLASSRPPLDYAGRQTTLDSVTIASQGKHSLDTNNAMMKSSDRVQIQPRISKYSSDSQLASSDHVKPQLPTRTARICNIERSSNPHEITGFEQPLPLATDHKPRLPPRRGTSPNGEGPLGNRQAFLEGEEAPSRLLDGDNNNLVNEHDTIENQSSSVGRIPLKRVPVPPPLLPPRQRRAGTYPASEPERSNRTNTGSTARNGAQGTASGAIDTKRERGQITLGSEISKGDQSLYETVWAANKGLLIPSPDEHFYDMYPPGASEMILNLVVRDIWLRSCLPNEVLQQIWGLVDRQNIRLLTKEEFVVGMWLIDWKLDGGQLPAVVPDSVWNSIKRP